MNSYEVTLTVLTKCTYSVEAEDKDEAYKLACIEAEKFDDIVREDYGCVIEQTSFN